MRSKHIPSRHTLGIYLKQITLFLVFTFVVALLIRFTRLPLFGPLDFKLFYLINSGIKNQFFDFAIPFFSLDWLTLVLVGVFFIYLIVNKGIKISLVFLIAFILMLPFGTLLKKTAGLTRPYASLTDVYYYNNGQWLLIKNPITSNNHNRTSFPSGHTLRFFILVGFLWNHKKIRSFLLFLGLLVIVSRTYTGAHYPSDSIATAFIATYLGFYARKIASL